MNKQQSDETSTEITVKYAYCLSNSYYYVNFDVHGTKEKWVISYSSTTIVENDKIKINEYEFEASSRNDETKSFQLLIEKERIETFITWVNLHEIWHVGPNAPSIGSFDGTNYILYPVIKMIGE